MPRRRRMLDGHEIAKLKDLYFPVAVSMTLIMFWWGVFSSGWIYDFGMIHVFVISFITWWYYSTFRECFNFHFGGDIVPFPISTVIFCLELIIIGAIQELSFERIVFALSISCMIHYLLIQTQQITYPSPHQYNHREEEEGADADADEDEN